VRECHHHKIFNYLEDTKQFKEWIKTILDNLTNDAGNEKLFLEYLKYTSEYDTKTNQDSFTLNSRLFKLLTKEHKDYYDLTKNIKNDHRIRWMDNTNE
jgi:hypothetical protein